MKKYLIIGLLAIATSVVYAQGWQPCGLTDNSFLKTIGTSVVVHNGKIFEFHRNGVVNTLNVSTDNGATWSVVNSDWMTANSNSLGYNSATLASVGKRLYLFAGGVCGEVLFSTD